MPTIIGIKPGRNGQFQSSEGRIEITQTVVYWVQAESKDVDEFSVLTTPGLPIVNITRLGSSGAVCTSKSAKQNEQNRTRWEVACNFSTAPQTNGNDEEEGTQSGDPTTWKVLVKFTTEEILEVNKCSAAGTPYYNSAKGWLPEAPQTPLKIGVLRFTQYEAPTTTWQDLLTRTGTTNGSTFLAQNQYTWLCTIEDAELVQMNRAKVWKIDYSLKYNPRDWRIKVIDRGKFYLDGSNNRQPFVDEKKNPIIGNLNGSGGSQAATVAPQLLAFHAYATNTFSFIRIQ